MDWMQDIHGDPLAWLQKPEPWGVRYLALRDLMGLSNTDPELATARGEAHRCGPIREVLEHMAPEGYWERPGPGYNPKYRSTVWALILLAQLGASIHEDARIERACSYILDHALTPFGQFSASGAPSGTADCLQGNLCMALMDLGVQDARLEKAYDWMARSVTGEGVAPKSDREAAVRYYAGKCGPLFACGSNLGEPCAWGGAKVMLAFGRLPRERWTDRVHAAVQAGAEFFLGIDPAGAAWPSPMAGKPSGNWWKFGFPVFYVTDLLEVLEGLGRLGKGSDPRLARVIEMVVSKQDAQGRWVLEYNYAGKTWGEYGTRKAPNQWVTLRALRALKFARD